MFVGNNDFTMSILMTAKFKIKLLYLKNKFGSKLNFILIYIINEKANFYSQNFKNVPFLISQDTLVLLLGPSLAF